MKWLAAPLILLMAFATPASLAVSCALPSAKSSVPTCECCGCEGGACCMKSSNQNSIPLKASAVVASLLQPLSVPNFRIESYSIFLAPLVTYRAAPPAQHVRPPPDSTLLSRFLI